MEGYYGIPRAYSGNTLGNTWGILGEYLGNKWGILGQYLGNTWAILGQYLGKNVLAPIILQVPTVCLEAKVLRFNLAENSIGKEFSGNSKTNRSLATWKNWHPICRMTGIRPATEKY